MENDNNALATQHNAHSYSPDEINTIRKTCAPNANDDELKMFLTLAGKYSLDPFAHEIWFVNMQGRNTIITARDG